MTLSTLPQFHQSRPPSGQELSWKLKNHGLAKVDCAHCRGAVSIVNFTDAVKGGDLVLYGSCTVYGNEVGRLIEGLGA